MVADWSIDYIPSMTIHSCPRGMSARYTSSVDSCPGLCYSGSWPEKTIYNGRESPPESGDE